MILDQGISLPGIGLWLDPSRKKPFAAVTHAHSDHAGWHGETIATPATLALMHSRLGASRGGVRSLAFHEASEIPDARVTLVPAGHVLGSAMVFAEAATGSLLYTGDFKLRPSLTCEPATPVRADTLIMETTFGLPRYRLPGVGQVVEEIVGFCRRALEEFHQPVLLAYSLGKAQEVIARLAGSGLPLCAHPSVLKMTEVYRRFGVDLPEVAPDDAPGSERCVLITPPQSRPRGRKNMRTAIITGWAMDSSARFRSRCDAAFAMSDHADYGELLDFVENVAPKRVFTVHGFVEEFACDLRRRGIEAWALGGGNQLELPFAA